ncbi:MAG: High-affinity branched-chain amino acid transport system permease protein LivH [Verrucomicrobiae bacterium]|nr:High-affinity branched-chain amino acid transport system permease protein LivH [Verrucomicrobiae bacterium]
MSGWEVFLQQLIIGLSNGMIIALIALGYTMVYGIVELINFAHGDLFMLGSFLALTIVGLCTALPVFVVVLLLLTLTPLFSGGLNWLVDRLAYRHLRHSIRLAPLVSAIGVSFVFLNVGLLWGGVPMDVFGLGKAAAAPKDFPVLVSNDNLLGDATVQFTAKDALVFVVTIPLMIGLTWFVKRTRTGKAMRAVAQDQTAAELMGINVDRVVGQTFLIGGGLAGVASVVFALYNNTIYFQMGYRAGMDAFTAAVLGGIGSLPGAVLGGLCIGLARAFSDQYIATGWTNVIVFTILVLVLVFRPAGILGSKHREKV